MRFPWGLFLLWVRRDVRSRYAGSIAGLLWAFLSPLATVALFYVLFAFVFKVRIPELGTEAGYFYYLLAGLLPWLSISDGLARASGVIVGHEQFLQKQAFPVEILPISAILSSLVPQAVGFVALLALLILAGLMSVVSPLLLLLAVLAQLVLTVGLGMSLAMFAMYFRDLLHVMPVLLQFLFYATPILYQLSMVPERYHQLYLLNPVAPVIQLYHAAFLGMTIGASVWFALTFWVLTLGFGGMLLFRLLKPSLGETL
jgi:lipopolysaccharide transport system permease protein